LCEIACKALDTRPFRNHGYALVGECGPSGTMLRCYAQGAGVDEHG
jgi:hypothetical protein